jgi:hypothetical protein
LLCLIDTAHQQAYADGEQLDIGQRNTDITRYHEALIEHSVENVQKIGCSGNSWNSLHNIQENTEEIALGTVKTRSTHVPHPNQPRHILSTIAYIYRHARPPIVSGRGEPAQNVRCC